MKNKTGLDIGVLRSDNGGEYTGAEFQVWLKTRGTTHQTSTLRTPEQNGVAKRYNRIIIESAKSMLLPTGLG